MRTSLSLATLLLAALLAAGCDNEGPAERAGEAIDETADDIGDAVDDAADDVADAAEDACEEVNEDC